MKKGERKREKGKGGVPEFKIDNLKFKMKKSPAPGLKRDFRFRTSLCFGSWTQGCIPRSLKRSGSDPSVGRTQDYINSGASTSVIVLSSLTSTCSDGPAVSLNGSPTVSPTTEAL